MELMTNCNLLVKYNQPNLTDILGKLYLTTKPENNIDMLNAQGFSTQGLQKQLSLTDIHKTRALLADICTNTQYIFYSIKVKLHYLIDAIIYSISQENILSLARSTRALLEHVSSLDYLISNGNSTLDKVSNNKSNQQILQELEKYIDKYEEMFYNSKYFSIEYLKKKNKGKQKSIHVNDLLNSTKSFLPKVREYYEFLCDFTHPYFGSNILATTKSLSGQEIDEQTRDHYIVNLFHILNVLLQYFTKKEEKFQSMLHLFNGYRISSLEDNNKEVIDIFVVKNQWRIGDGSSQEKAILFTTPRNGLEYAKTVLEFCKSQKINEKDFQRFEAPDGTVYFIYEKDGQPLWVQMPQ